MAKKSAFTKGGPNLNLKKNPFNVKSATHKTKTKAVKTNVKKLKANVKAQQESADSRLKALHEQMVVKRPQTNPKKITLKKAVKKMGPNTSTVQSNLEKMNVN